MFPPRPEQNRQKPGPAFPHIAKDLSKSDDHKLVATHISRSLDRIIDNELDIRPFWPDLTIREKFSADLRFASDFLQLRVILDGGNPSIETV